MMRRTSARLVPMMSLREDSGFSDGVMPAAASSGSVSSKMRPLERASVMPVLLMLESSVSGRFQWLLPFGLSLSKGMIAHVRVIGHGLRQAQPERVDQKRSMHPLDARAQL